MKQTDIYTEALVCLRLILQTDHPEFKNWLDWLGRDIEDLPNMRGNHDYIFDFLKSVCYTFGHRNGKRQGISPEALMEECVHDAEQASYHPHKGLNRAIAQHLMQGNLQDNLDRL